MRDFMQIKNANELIAKVNQLQREHKLDLSLGEDLSIALMNLISIEEHLYFSAMKTGKKKYFVLLNEVRETRKKFMKELVKDSEGEVWCISKHLLAASMRLIEVGTKHLSQGNEKKAVEMFNDAFNLYSMFWGLNLKLIESDAFAVATTSSNEKKHFSDSVKVLHAAKGSDSKIFKSVNEKPLYLSVRDSFSSIVKKILECCKE